MSENIRVLVVDDNNRYRQAFCQNLVMQGFEVIQAEDADQAMQLLRFQEPDVLVTDLQMRRETEGLDLIRDCKEVVPCMPVIMISAVGTFDEGAEASRLGAAHVLSKVRIDEEMSILYQCIRQSHERYLKNRQALEKIAGLTAQEESTDDNESALQTLRSILDNAELEPYVKGEAYEELNRLNESQQRQQSRQEAERTSALLAESQKEQLEQVNTDLERTIQDFAHLDDDTREAMRTAEYLYRYGGDLGANLDLSRTICFSYCFSVENQAKSAMRKKLTKFLSDNDNINLVRSMLERDSDHVNMFLQQHLLQVMRDHQMDITIDNIRQTFQRILAHRAKYRPDGLKALGIMVLLFGRDYTVKTMGKSLEVKNPLGLKGLENEEEVIRFAQQLIGLQHSRNPYIHPEIDGQANLDSIRNIAIGCLNLVMQLK